jgi:acyl-CoA thioesterase
MTDQPIELGVDCEVVSGAVANDVEPSPDPLSFPLQEMVGFTIDKGDGVETASLDVNERHLNPHGVLHGGIPFTMLDTAMGAAVMSVIPEGFWCTTIDIHTRFLRPCGVGQVSATATDRRAGRPVVHVDAIVTDPENREVVSAAGTFALIDIPS